MYYTVYKTTCLLNSKFYIGKHQTKNLNDGYFGSGKLLVRAVNKHGIQNFVTEIVAVYDTEQKMNLAERILVVCDSAISYNLCPGGQGGFGYINTSGVYPSEKRKILAKINGTKGIDRARSSKSSKAYVLKNGVSLPFLAGAKATYFKAGQGNPQYGKPKSEEHKKKIAESVKRTLALKRQ